ncbi:hypothetical protein JW960_08270 [candidate division KSB1 bacterium]|nr:hypothetical protein [candidate division KSB1 bacterium]
MYRIIGVFLILLIQFFSGCAVGNKGKLGGQKIAITTDKMQQKKLIADFFDSKLKIGSTTIQEVEKELGFPTTIFHMNDNRTIWIYEVSEGNWWLLFGTASLKRYIFEFEDNVVSNYYQKKSGRKLGILYPTITAEPVF